MKFHNIAIGTGAAMTPQAGTAHEQALSAIRTSIHCEPLDLECRMQRIAGTSADFGEGVMAFLEKRPAQFAGK